MKDLQKLFKECLQIVKDCGIEPNKIDEVTINYRAKSRFGQACRKKGNHYSINISSFILADNTIEKAVKETIIHEILHCCKDGMNHNGKWKEYASIINRKTPYKITRCGTYEEFGLKDFDKKNSKYAVKCQNCGRIVYKQRWCSIIANPQDWRCGCCNGEFKRIK